MAAVFVLPVTTVGQQGPVAAMMSTAGWAAAAGRMLGRSWIVTPDGTLDPAEARRRGSAPVLSTDDAPAWRRRVPTLTKTAAKDVRQWRRARRFHVDPHGPWADGPVAFVWQRHELFHCAGIELAEALDAPSVLFVPATLVWEARRWGTNRPGWSRVVEAFGEQPALTRADVVACGSAEVAEQAIRLGASPERVLVTPTGVDLDRFAAPVDRDAVRRDLGIADRFVVGWVGSFRPFHALEQAIDAVAALDGATLLLVGDGAERPALERYAAERGCPVVFTGTVGADALPAHLAAMDAAIILSPRDGAFHYSPLKLGEYLAAGLPVVAPDVPSLTGRLRDGTDVILVPPADADALVAALGALRDDDGLRARLSRAALAAAEQRWGWDQQVERLLERLGTPGVAHR